MSDEMKVCFIVGTLGRGGAEKQLIYMLRALKHCGVSCRVLCLAQGESHEREIKSLGIEVEWVGRSKKRGVRLLNIINNLRKVPADIIQSSHFYTNIYAGLAGRALGVPSIGAIRSDLYSELRMNGFLGKWQLHLPSFLVTNSKMAYQRAIQKGIRPENVKFVKNVVDVNSNEMTKSPEAELPIKVLFVGRLDKNKRPERFVELASVLTQKFAEVPLQFQIAGDGILRGELESLANKLKLSSESLEFLGVCNNMNKVYAQADILVSTSEREGTSNVILEAMSHGIPVVATNVGGTPGILNENRGILIEPGNEKQLEEAATKLIFDKQLRKQLGLQGREYIKNNHSIEQLQAHLTEIYKKLLKKPSS